MSNKITLEIKRELEICGEIYNEPIADFVVVTLYQDDIDAINEAREFLNKASKSKFNVLVHGVDCKFFSNDDPEEELDITSKPIEVGTHGFSVEGYYESDQTVTVFNQGIEFKEIGL